MNDKIITLREKDVMFYKIIYLDAHRELSVY